MMFMENLQKINSFLKGRRNLSFEKFNALLTVFLINHNRSILSDDTPLITEAIEQFDSDFSINIYSMYKVQKYSLPCKTSIPPIRNLAAAGHLARCRM